MPKQIGPRFEQELKAAGLLGLPFSWGEDSIIFGDVTEEQKAAILAVRDAHDPAAAAPIYATSTPLQFIERFTEAEQIAIVTAAMSSPALRLWYDKLMAAQEVVFTDTRLSAGLNALVTAGLITADRKAELLTP